MRLSIFVFAAVACLGKASPVSDPTQKCLTFAQAFMRTRYSAETTILNSTFIAANSSAGNEYPFCRVSGQVSYATNETLNFLLYLPDASVYNGRFMAVGNGGMAGVIDTSNMITQLNAGFAVAGGDSGHLAALNNGGGGAPGIYLPYLHDLNQVNAWIHNAISIFTPSARKLVQLYYGNRPKYSYYNGCSTGGAQGFALAQFHPHLFDGIYAGSPGNWYSHLALSFLWNGHKTSNASFMPQVTLDAITDAVIDKCDKLDGVKDGMIENPLSCPFDIESMACTALSTNTSLCLTAAQLEGAKAVYAGPTSTIDGSQIYPGFSVGSEVGWFYQEQQLADAFSIPILQNAVYNNLEYDSNAFNYGSDVATVDQKIGKYIDEITNDLSEFKKLGGKLLVTQGWADQYNAATWPIEHLQGLQGFFGGDVSDFFNLFMVPGGGHCGQAPNYPASPQTYHVVDALIEWVEKGEKPANVLTTGTDGAVSISRLLCPWPETAKYLGGDQNSANSYVCQ